VEDPFEIHPSAAASPAQVDIMRSIIERAMNKFEVSDMKQKYEIVEWVEAYVTAIGKNHPDMLWTPMRVRSNLNEIF
jgi:hypothetical protein